MHREVPDWVLTFDKYLQVHVFKSAVCRFGDVCGQVQAAAGAGHGHHADQGAAGAQDRL